MKNIYSYNEFCNEGLFDNLFKQVFSLLDKESGQQLNDFTKKISNINDIKLAIPIMKENIKKLNDNFLLVVDKGKPEEIEKELKDSLIILYSSLQKMAEQYKIRGLRPEVLYKETNNKILFNTFVRKDIKDFMANIDVNVKAIISEIKKKSGIVEEKTNEAEQLPTGQNVEKNATQPTQGQAQPNNPAQSPDPKQQKFKDEMKKFATNGLFGPLIKQITELMSNLGPSVPDKEVQDMAKSMRGSKNLDSKKQFLNTISSIDDPKILGKLRDTLATDKVINKDEYDKMKF